MEKSMKVIIIRPCWAPLITDTTTNVQHAIGDVITVTVDHGRELISYKKAVEFSESALKDIKAAEAAKAKVKETKATDPAKK